MIVLTKVFPWRCFFPFSPMFVDFHPVFRRLSGTRQLQHVFINGLRKVLAWKPSSRVICGASTANLPTYEMQIMVIMGWYPAAMSEPINDKNPYKHRPGILCTMNKLCTSARTRGRLKWTKPCRIHKIRALKYTINWDRFGFFKSAHLFKIKLSVAPIIVEAKAVI